MRFVLRQQDTNAAPPPAGEPVKAHASPQNPSHTAEDVRDSLREWRQRWRQIMKEAVIYFDDIPQGQVDRFRSYLGVLGSHVQPFFDQKVTHVISDNQRSDVAAKARDDHRKVYTTEKLARFLSSLLGHSLNTALDASQSAKLARMLEEDTRLSANAASNSRKDDFYHFKGPYLLIYDPSTYNRPLCIKEWKPAPRDEGEWPQLRRAPMGMSPFTARSIIKSEKRKYQQHEQLQLKAQHAQQQQQHDHDHDHDHHNDHHDHHTLEPHALQNGSQDSEDDYKEEKPLVSVQEPSAKRRLAAPKDANEDKENMLPVQQPSMAQRAPPARTTNSTRLREFGEIVASGVPRYSQTSANPFSAQRDAVGSKEMVNLRRKVMPRMPTLHDSAAAGEGPHSIAAAARAATSAAETHSASAAAFNANASGALSQPTSLGTKPAQSRPQAVPRPRAKKPGYCENCLEKYDDLGEHLVSKRHRIFASSEQKFFELDRVIATLQNPSQAER